MSSDIPALNARQVMETICYHTIEHGGTQTAIFGTQGSGKTTGLLQLARNYGYIKENKLIKESVIWRGRETDYWLTFSPDECVICISSSDLPVFKVKDINLKNLDVSKYTIKSYTDFDDLLHKIEASKINIVYEPTNYKVSKSLRKLIPSLANNKTLKNNLGVISPYVWWYEFFYFLLKHKSNNHISVIIDEAGELFPSRVDGVNWWLVNWFKSRFIDFRKRNVSFLIAAHHHNLIYPELLPMFQYYIYMRGSTPVSKSLLNYKAPVMQPVGCYYVDGGLWGHGSFADIPNKIQHLVRFEHPEEEDEEKEEKVIRRFVKPPDVKARILASYYNKPIADIGRIE